MADLSKRAADLRKSAEQVDEKAAERRRLLEERLEEEHRKLEERLEEPLETLREIARS